MSSTETTSSEDEVSEGETDETEVSICTVLPYAHEPLPRSGQRHDARRKDRRKKLEGYPDHEGDEW